MLKRFQSVALAAALAFSVTGGVTVAAHAETVPGDAITVYSNENDHTYSAYQILSAQSVTADRNQVTGVAWGNGINHTALLSDGALKKAPLNQFFSAVTGATTAAEFARYMETAKDNAQATRELAVVLKKHLNTGNGKPFQGVQNSAPGKQQKGKFSYTSQAGIETGFYLIADSNPNSTAALTFPILKVVGPTEVVSKSSVPESDKVIIANPGATGNAFNPTANTSFSDERGGTYNLSEVADITAGTEAEFLLRGTVSATTTPTKPTSMRLKTASAKGWDSLAAALKFTSTGKK